MVNAGVTGFLATALAYGARSNGAVEPDVFYVAAGTTIWHRVTLGGPINILDAYPGSSVVALAMSPEDYTFVVVVDIRGGVWSSSDEGATWENING